MQITLNLGYMTNNGLHTLGAALWCELRGKTTENRNTVLRHQMQAVMVELERRNCNTDALRGAMAEIT